MNYHKCKPCRPDQTPGSVVSDLGLHCLPVSILWDTRHKRVEQEYLMMSDLGLHRLPVSILWDPNNNTACTNTHIALSNDFDRPVPSSDPYHPAQLPIQCQAMTLISLHKFRYSAKQ